MKVTDLIRNMEVKHLDLPLIVHDNHETYEVKEVKFDIVFGRKCFAIVVDRFPESESD